MARKYMDNLIWLSIIGFWLWLATKASNGIKQVNPILHWRFWVAKHNQKWPLVDNQNELNFYNFPP